MELISKSPHPNIVGYYGCRVRRGRITAIILEQIDKTLTQYAETAEFQELDRDRFAEAIYSAVDHLHSLGLAHNDINPHNIMVKDGALVLIDFGSCRPFGKRLESLGTEGWYEELFSTSEKKHDVLLSGEAAIVAANPAADGRKIAAKTRTHRFPCERSSLHHHRSYQARH